MTGGGSGPVGSGAVSVGAAGGDVGDGSALAIGSHQMVATSASTQIVPDKEVVGSYSEDMSSSKGRGSDQGPGHTAAASVASHRFLCCGSCGWTSEDSRMR